MAKKIENLTNEQKELEQLSLHRLGTLEQLKLENKALSLSHNDELAGLRSRFEGHIQNYYDIQEITLKHNNEVRNLESRIYELQEDNNKLKEK